MIDVGGPRLFACDECPIVEQLDRRLAIAEEYPQYGDFQFDHCGCDKVYDEFWQYGYCEDAWVDILQHYDYGRRKTGRAYRRKMRRNHAEKFCNEYKRRKRYSPGPYPSYSYIDGEYVLTGNYICYPQNSRNKVYFKKVSSKTIRRNKLNLPRKGNWCHKLFDYKWAVY